MTVKIRLYVDHPLGAGQTVLLNRDQAHYLFGVMRQSLGAQVALFNGREGEWRAEVSQTGKRTGALRCLEQTRPLQMPPDLWLLFAPIKKARTDFIVEKAAELLSSHQLNVTEVAFEVGYQSLSHFSKAFAQEKELTPSQFMKRQT